MRKIWLICWLELLASCAAQHAPRVNCDGKFRPINTSAPLVAAPLATAPAVKAVGGGP
jgi:hypothetical protein